MLSGRVRYDSHNTSWRFQSTLFIDVSEFRGWDMDNMETLIEKLMPVDGSERLSLQVVSLIGVGGIGKTTLAQLTYNDAWVQEYFELKFWICVSHSTDAAEIAKGILKDACPRGGQLDSMLDSLKEMISERKFILVLDNVWEVNLSQWNTLKNILRFGCHGSKILLTTRNKRVARMLDCLQENIQDIGVIPDEYCWQILSSIAFFGRMEPERANIWDTSKCIASTSDGLPLAARVLGILLRFKSSLEEWKM
ncbi:hypothetical protein ABFS83_12G056200 [Erythranthe nasuta]